MEVPEKQLFFKESAGIVKKSNRGYFFCAFGLLALSLYAMILWKFQSEVRMVRRKDGPAFEWLRNRNFLDIFMEPVRDTALIVPKGISEVKERRNVACFVMSAPGSMMTRNAIRKTWGPLIKPIFMIGLSNETVLESIRLEAKVYNDIIVENFVDCYANLTLKTAFAMKNFLRYFENSTYFLKMDDDVFLNVKQLNNFLATFSRSQLAGRYYKESWVLREKNGKYYVPSFLYSEDHYPDYLPGACYVIPGQFIRDIYETAMLVPFFNMEDAFFVGLVAVRILKHELHDDWRFDPNPCKSPCECDKRISSHAIKLQDLTNLWKNLESLTDCETTTEKTTMPAAMATITITTKATNFSTTVLATN